MARHQINLFGKFSIRNDTEELTRLHGSKAQELLCYLLLHRDRPLHRETLSSLLWPDSPKFQSMKYLRQALWQLHAALHSKTGNIEDALLLVDSGWVRINAKGILSLDVAEFENAFTLMRQVWKDELDDVEAQRLKQAVELYKGDLLEGWYQDWCLFERERLQNAYLEMLDRLMRYFEGKQEYERGLIYGDRILCVDHANERTHQRLMRLYYRMGDRSNALRQYERCAAALQEDLGVKPSEVTAALYEQIRSDRLEDFNPSLTRASTMDSAPPKLLNHLRQFQIRLAELEHRMLEEIQALEAASKGER